MELFALQLFAQQKGGAGGGDAVAAGAITMGLVVAYIAFLVGLIVLQILYLLAVSRCFALISRRNRQMEPGQVWLCLIPIFGTVWTILMILRLADSLRDEYYDRGLRGDGDFGKTLGIVYFASLMICWPIGLVVWIMYWLKVSNYSKELRSDRGGDYGDYDDRDRDRDDEDDDRDRGRGKRRSREDDDDYDDRNDDRDDDRGGKPWDKGRR
jgi:hypothetical protein